MAANGVRVNVVFTALPTGRAIIERARELELAGRNVRVVSLEDLIYMKAISEREKDWEDASRLLRRYRGRLDIGYLEPRLREAAEALDRPGIMRVLEI